MTRKLLIGLIVVIIFIVSFTYLDNYFNSVSVKLTVPNTKSITVKQDDHIISKTTSNQTMNFRAPKFSHLTISFIGTGMYETSSRNITIKDKDVTETIQPYFSKDELKKLAVENSAKIQSVILAYNPAINDLYSINNITLYHFGEWASATLVWKGSESENSDTLHVVLGEKNNTWSVIYQPDILLFQNYYKAVPLDILESINNSNS